MTPNRCVCAFLKEGDMVKESYGASYFSSHEDIQAAGMVDVMSGRYSIVAAPGPGSPAVVKVFKLWLLTPIPGFPPQVDAKSMHQDSQGPVTTVPSCCTKTVGAVGSYRRSGLGAGLVVVGFFGIRRRSRRGNRRGR